MSQNSPPSGPWDVVKEMVKQLRNELLVFALATIIVIGLMSASIASAWVALIYVVVIVVLVVVSLPAITEAIAKLRPSSSPAPLPRPAEPPVPTAVELRSERGSTEAPLSGSEQLRAYLDSVMADNNLLRLGGISPDASDPQRRLAEAKNPGTLSDVFISLRIDRYRGEPEEKRPAEPERLVRSEREQLTALEALSRDDASRAVLLGLPGAGKTSVMRYLAFRMAEAYLRPQTLKGTLPEWQGGVLLPVIVSLARLADALPEKPERGLDGRVRQFIQDEVEAKEALRGFAKRIESEARERGVLFLFDGLDEVAPDKRAVVKAALLAFLSTRSQCRAAVTCRTFSYGDEAWRLEGWPAFQLTPLSQEAQREFIGKWYQTLIRNDPASKATYEKKAQGLEQAVFARDARQLQQISDNPLLLTLIAIVHTHLEELPRSRVRIYEECVKLLLLRWQTRRQPTAPLRSILEAMSAVAPDKAASLEGLLMRGLYEVAFQAREGRGLQQGETTMIDVHSLRAALEPKLGKQATDEFASYCQTANGLLLAQGSRCLPHRPTDEEPVDCFAFPHPSFEEYLAARYIAMLDSPHEELAQRNAQSDRWFYVGLFLGEHASIVSQKPRDALDLVDELLSTRRARPTDEGHWRNVWLAGTIWPIFSSEFPDRCDAALQARVIEQLKTLCLTGQLDPRERAQAGNALAAVGDPRDLGELVAIPEGKFWMGSDKATDSQAWDDELPQHEVLVPAFQICKYPATVRQWKQFVESTRYDKGDPRALQGPDNHPAVWVSWYDAQEFCQWLTNEWRKSGKIGQNEIVRLPTEAEWEKAARGTDKRIRSWGDEPDPGKANVGETGIGGTSAVGIFPTGASPYGCLDMIGNVLEWTQSKWKDYSYQVNDGREELGGNESRVLRGGAWSYYWGGARCAYRGNFRPDYRYVYIGFRVVVAPNSRF